MATTSSTAGGIEGKITDPIPTPLMGKSGSWSVISSCTIAAPPSAVYAAILDHESYPKWNSFCPRFEITSQPKDVDASSSKLAIGTKFKLHVHMAGNGVENFAKGKAPWTKSAEELTIMHEMKGEGGKSLGFRCGWKGLLEPVIKCERVHEMVEVEIERTQGEKIVGCEYSTWGTFGGPLAWVVKMTQGASLKDRFGDSTRDLKNWCEGGMEGRGVE